MGVSFKQADVKRAVKGAIDGGLSIGRVLVRPCGTIEVITGQIEESQSLSTLERWQLEKAKRNAS